MLLAYLAAVCVCSKQADSVKGAVDTLNTEAKRLLGVVHECDATLAHQRVKRQEADDVQRQLAQKLDKHRDDIEQRERDVDAVKKSLEFERQQHTKLQRRRAEMELEQKDESQELKRALEQLAAHSKAFDVRLRRRCCAALAASLLTTRVLSTGDEKTVEATTADA